MGVVAFAAPGESSRSGQGEARREPSGQSGDAGSSSRMLVAQSTGSGSSDRQNGLMQSASVNLQSALAALSSGQHGESNSANDIAASLQSATAELQRSGKGRFRYALWLKWLAVIDGWIRAREKNSAHHDSWRDCHLHCFIS